VLPVHREHAPRRRFRGQRRYFRRVHRDANAFAVDADPDAWWDHWHYHADWPGWGNRGWRYRREHVRALCRVFQTIVAARDRFATPFQTWIYISDEDAGQDATYLHTPSPNSSPFPFAPILQRIAPPPLAAFVAPLLPELALEYGVDEAGYRIWARGVGEPLVR
jgi:hypothetical protein